MPTNRIVPPHATDSNGHHDDRYYQTGTVDGLIAAEVDAINARRLAFPMVSGKYYNTLTHGVGRTGSVATAALTADRIYFSPIYVPDNDPFDRIGITVTTAQAASEIRFGFFSIDLATGDAAPSLDAGVVATTTTGDKEATINHAPGPGIWWLAMQPTHNVSVQAVAAAAGYEWSTSGAAVATRLQTGGSSGAFSNPETTNTGSSTAYLVYVRKA